MLTADSTASTSVQLLMNPQVTSKLASISSCSLVFVSLQIITHRSPKVTFPTQTDSVTQRLSHHTAQVRLCLLLHEPVTYLFPRLS